MVHLDAKKYFPELNVFNANLRSSLAIAMTTGCKHSAPIATVQMSTINIWLPTET